MLDFIAKYWIEVLLGLITTGASLFCKKFYSMYKAEREAREKTVIEEFDAKLQSFYNRTQEDNEIINRRIDGVENMLFVLKNGILSIQGHQFKKKCNELLKESHELTLDEWLQIVADHDAYNALGGNHEGDELFGLLKIKAERFLTD